MGKENMWTVLFPALFEVLTLMLFIKRMLYFIVTYIMDWITLGGKKYVLIIVLVFEFVNIYIMFGLLL